MIQFIKDLFSETGKASSRRVLLYVFAGFYVWHFVVAALRGTLTQYTEEQYVQILLMLIFAVVFDKVPSVVSSFKTGTNPPGGDRPKDPPVNP